MKKKTNGPGYSGQITMLERNWKTSFQSAGELVSNSKHIYRVSYDDTLDAEACKRLNEVMLKEISGKAIVYCLWIKPQGSNK